MECIAICTKTWYYTIFTCVCHIAEITFRANHIKICQKFLFRCSLYRTFRTWRITFDILKLYCFFCFLLTKFSNINLSMFLKKKKPLEMNNDKVFQILNSKYFTDFFFFALMKLSLQSFFSFATYKKDLTNINLLNIITVFIL